VTDPTNTFTNTPIPLGVQVARWAGHALGITLIGLGLYKLSQESSGLFPLVQALFFLFYGILLNIPYHRIGAKYWKWGFGLMTVASAAFVFIMIFTVMFAYMAAAEEGKRLGVPGFEGMLIFFALMQVPAVLFQRRPDLLD